MANNCYFEVKLAGKEEEVKEVAGYFTEYYDYNFFEWELFSKKEKDFVKNMGLSMENTLVVSAMSLSGIFDKIFKNGFYVFESKEKALKILKNIMKDRLEYQYELWGKELEKSEVFNEFEKEFNKFEKGFDFESFKGFEKLYNERKNNLPKGNHFFRIFDFVKYDEGITENGEYIINAYGDCAWSLHSCVLEDGYYSSWKEFEGKDWFKGTCLEKVHEKFPNLKIEMFSEETGCQFSEHILINEDGFSDECEELVAVCYQSVEEAKEDGLEMSEDLINENIYKKLPSWFTPAEENTQYFFEWSI